MIAFLLLRDNDSAPGPNPTPQVTWGWMSKHAVQPDLPARQYLEQLATSVEEWFDEQPTERVALAKRINEFKAGCDRLIATKHEPLSSKDQEWLNSRCVNWSRRLAYLSRRMDYATPNLDEIATSTGDLVRLVAKVLRERKAG